MKRNQNLGENRKESQLPIKSRGCNKTQGFRGNCDSQGKLGMCPSLAEPNSDGFPRSNVSNHEPQATEKFFDPTIFQKCCRGVGEQPTFAEQMKLHNETQPKSRREPQRIAIAIPKASWGCAPALPNQIQVVFLEAMFPIMSRRQPKSFLIQQFFKNVGEVWASSPHLRSK